MPGTERVKSAEILFINYEEMYSCTNVQKIPIYIKILQFYKNLTLMISNPARKPRIAMDILRGLKVRKTKVVPETVRRQTVHCVL